MLLDTISLPNYLPKAGGPQLLPSLVRGWGIGDEMRRRPLRGKQVGVYVHWVHQMHAQCGQAVSATILSRQRDGPVNFHHDVPFSHLSRN